MNRLVWVTRPVLAGILAMMLLILPLGIPLLVPLQMVAPLPVFLTALWGGTRAGWIGAFIPITCALLLGGGIRFPLTAFLLFFAFPLLAAWLIRGGWKATQCLALAFVIGFGLLLLFGGWILLTDTDFETEVILKLDIFKANVMAAIAKKGGDAVLLAEVKNSLEPFIRVLALLLPSLVLSGWFLLHVGNLLFARNLVKKWGGEKVFPQEDLTAWQLPQELVWLFIGAVGLSYATQGFPRMLGANVALLLSILYFFQGMAVVQSGFRHHLVGSLGRGFFYFALIFWSHLVIIVTGLGLFDLWVDFRKRFFSTCKEGDNPPGS